MKILYFYQYFSTPNGSWGTRVYEFAKNWVEEGHEVTVVSSVFAKSDLEAEKLLETQYFDGIKVKIINVRTSNKDSVLKRVLGFLTYAFFSCFYAVTLKADIVIASSGPITVGIPGLLARWLRGKKLIFEARDLWPDGAIELGILKNKTIIALTRAMEKFCYNSSSLIVALSPGMRDYIKNKHGHNNVISITNTANLDLFDPEKADDSNIEFASRSYSIYTGNIGEVNNSYWLYNTAKVLKDRGREDVKIVLIGDGQQREELVELAKENEVGNLIFKSLMPKKNLVQYVLNAKFSLIPLKGLPVLDTSSPNKLFESLAAGVPVIQNTNGWIKDFLEEHQLGFTLDPNKPEELADLLIEYHDSDLDMELRNRARTVAKSHFDKNILSAQYLEEVIKVSES